MADGIITALWFIVAISVLVAVHEYGHYIVGRWCGMKVLRFSIGFGKPLWKKTGKGPDRTEYCVSTIPLGGYVRFLDSREGPVDPEDEGRAFNQRPIPARIAVLLAGPFFNFFFAIFVYWLLFVGGEMVPRPAVGDVEPGSFADDAGLERGDRILMVGNDETETWEQALLAILDVMVSDGRIPLRVADADGNERSATIVVGDDRTRLTEPGKLFDGLGFQPWRANSVVGEIQAGSAAESAGMLSGDRILSIDGKATPHFYDVVEAVYLRPNETVRVELERGVDVLTFDVTLGTRDGPDGEVYGAFGYGPAEDLRDFRYERKYPPLRSVGEAVERTWDASIFRVKMLGRMITGDVSLKNISGPINIAQFARATAERGMTEFMAFLAIVSISLGVLNLLPVPVLDGGQIVYQLVEAAKGRPMSERAQIIGQQIGIFALILLMSFAFYNDLTQDSDTTEQTEE